MKKYILSLMVFFGGLCFLASCDDDRDSNPVIQTPTEFVMNTPAYSSSLIDLANSEFVHLSWSQPNYGYPAVVAYFLQLSKDGNFTVSVDEADVDESGATVADYVTIDGITACDANYYAETIDKALMQLYKWEEGNVPANVTVHARMEAKIVVANGLDYAYPIQSNVVTLNVAPYYMELSDALPEMWYLVGGCIGDGSWAGAIGAGFIPMSIIQDYEYDKKTGKGEITFTGYFTPDGFKLVKVPGGWDDQWGASDGGLTPVMNDGGSGNFTVPAAGYYTIALNTTANTLSINAADITPTVYESMGISGGFNDWGFMEMTPVNTVESMAGHNHIWTCTLETASDTEVKFLQDASWAVNWGNTGFPYGVGVSGGDNIPVKAGKYIVVFNDIDGTYSFNAQ